MKLVFIHGAGNTGMVWHYQSEHFPESDAISFPGHPEGQPRTSIEGYADWLHDYMLQRKYNAPVLVGHSMGGGVAPRCPDLRLEVSAGCQSPGAYRYRGQIEGQAGFPKPYQRLHRTATRTY
ncbi:MAG: alpha/beta hydrolase [Chloroflexi bacterium]|nr:alpha/beta hydrolase [Chloroflexota bacterium]